MKHLFKFLLVFSVLFSANQSVNAQSSYDRVYTIFQANCAFSSCHSNSKQEGGLDLEGSGADPKSDVYDKIVNVDPANAKAKSLKNKLVMPGDPYRSFIFRKCNNGLDPTSGLTSGEGKSMPETGGALDDVDKERIRQWIAWGAPKTGNPFADTLLVQYHVNGNGINSNPTPPPAPAASEGYQIHMGPFFLKPGTENEFFTKYDLLNDDATEVIRMESFLSQYSHHFILYRFPDDGQYASQTKYGYIPATQVDNGSLENVCSWQQGLDVVLPEGTAYRWSQNSILDLNSHYINATNKVLACHVYLNVYNRPVQPNTQIMYSELMHNFTIFIPGNQEVTLNAKFPNLQAPDFPNQTYYMWLMTTHTHSKGKDFKVWKRESNGNNGDQLFDASYKDGNIDSMYIGFDYKHVPVRHFMPFNPIDMKNGINFETKYKSEVSSLTTFGVKSTDEMMLVMMQYTLEPYQEPNAVAENAKTSALSKIYPNPNSGQFNLALSEELTQTPNLTLTIYDHLGRAAAVYPLTSGLSLHTIQLNELSTGIYAYQISGASGNIAGGKLSIRK